MRASFTEGCSPRKVQEVAHMPVRKPPVRRRSLLEQQPGIRELRIDYEAVFEAADRKRRHQNLRQNEVSGLLNVNPATLRSWGRGAGIRSDHLARVLMWLNRPLSDFVVTTEPAQPRPEARDDAGVSRCAPPTGGRDLRAVPAVPRRALPRSARP